MSPGTCKGKAANDRMPFLGEKKHMGKVKKKKSQRQIPSDSVISTS